MVTVKTILLVEDDQVASTTYRSRLEREGFHVETASDGLTALRTLLKLTVDLVILDLILPKLDGASVLKQMRMTPRLQNVPVIVLSNAASPELDEDALLTGPTRRLYKADCPFSALMQTIQELFAVTSAQTTRAEPASAGGTAPASANGQPKPDGNTIAPDNRSPEQSEFLKAVLQKIPEIREDCCAFIRAPANTQHLVELHQSANWVRTSAEEFGSMRIAMLARALEALLSEIKVKPSVITPSILQTIAQAVDCLALLLKSDEVDLARPLTHAKVLVVDDDAVCSMANVKSLKRANLDVESISDPVAALQKLQSTAVDAVLLDINMPGITGFELCEKLRHLPGCKTIPVIFITGYSNFDNRKQSVLSGGQDFITKPVFPLELALKTTLHLLKAQARQPIQRNVTPEPGTAGTRKTSLPEIGKPEASGVRVAVSRSTQPEPAIPIPLAVTRPLEMRAAAPEAFAPNAKAAASPATAGSSTTESPGSMPPQTASSAPTVLRMYAETHNGAAVVPPVKPTPGEERPVRSNQSETEPARLPDERSELQIKLEAEQQAAAKLRQEFLALQQNLHENVAALEKARLDLQDQGTRLQAATDAAGQAGKALQQNQARCQELEREAAALQAGRSELQAKLEAEQQRAAELERNYKASEEMLDESSETSAQARADLQQTSEKLHALTTEADLIRKQLQETETRRCQLETDLASAVAGRPELEAKWADEQLSSARLRQEFEALQKQQQDGTTALSQARADLQQTSEKLHALTTEADLIRKQLQETETRRCQLEQDLSGAVARRSELEAKWADEQQAAAKLRQEFEALQKQQQDGTTALNQARADLQQTSEKLHALTTEADLIRKQLQETETRRCQLETDLAGAVAGRPELEAKWADEQQSSARLRQEFEALQKQQQDGTTALNQARADLQQTSEKLHALTTEADLIRKQLQETETRCSQLEQDLAGAVAGRSELEAKWADEQRASGELLQEFEALQKQHQDNITILNQIRAELQQESAARARLESELQRQQESATASTSQTQNALGEQEARCGQLTQELTGLRREHQETQARLMAEQETAAKIRRDSAALQQQLNDSMATLEQMRNELEEQKTERARWETEHQNLAAANETLNLELTRPREEVESMKACPVQDAPIESRAQAFHLVAPGAGTVLLVGDFTGWQKEPVPMQPGVDGAWSATVALPPGTYLYMFVVDGNWCEDPACTERAPNGFGGHNMIRQVA